MKFRGLLLFMAGLVIGGLVVPVAAQSDPAENQLVIRSDGFIFLLRSGQRHLVSPVALSDEEINGYPEGEPYLSGLVPVEAVNAAPAGSFGGSPFGGSSNSSSGSSTSARSATATPKPSDSGPLDARFKTIPSEVEQNAKLTVAIEAPNGATCEGKVQYRGGKTTDFERKTASKNECKLELTVADDARTGSADIKVTVKRDSQSTNIEDQTEIVAGGKSSSGSGDIKLEFKDVPSSVKQGETLRIKIETEKSAECEGTIEFKDGEEEDFDSEKASSKGECQMEVKIPSNAKEGKATIKVKVVKDDDEAEEEEEIDIKKK